MPALAGERPSEVAVFDGDRGRLAELVTTSRVFAPEQI
jgi:hypothetical protein